MDTDPPRNILDEDVDDIETHDTLYASWTEVPGAQSYLVGVFTNDGLALWEESVDAGTGTEGIFEKLKLQLGQRYVVSVQAVGDAGISASTLSNGVTVVDVSDPVASCVSDTNTVFRGGESLQFTYEASDLTGIQHASLRIESSTSESTDVLFESHDLHAASIEGTVEWSSPSDWPLGAAVAYFEVRDGANHKVSIPIPITVEENSADTAETVEEADVVEVDAGASNDAESDASTDSGTGSPRHSQSGCACQSGNAPMDFTGLLLLLLWYVTRRFFYMQEARH